MVINCFVCNHICGTPIFFPPIFFPPIFFAFYYKTKHKDKVNKCVCGMNH